MFTAKIADHVFNVDNFFEFIQVYYKDYISDEQPEFTIAVTEEEVLSENQEGGSDYPPYLETLAVYRKLCETLLDNDVVLFHSSALEINGKAILFTAPSGTGKSTHATLWRRRFGDKVKMINDDKPLLHIGDEVTVYGTPYGGKDGIQNNTSAKVAAVVILHQAPENELKRITAEEAFPTILNQTYRCNTIEGIEKTLPLVDKLAHLPVYSLGCTISQEAVALVYNEIFKD